MKKHYLVTGGAGFIGSNYVHRLVEHGEKVTVYDNLSRDGARRNLEWLQQYFGQEAFQVIVGDVRDAPAIAEAARDADVIVHLAGQVAVTMSVVDPRDDFESNALGTFNTLEAARLSGRSPIFIYSSTNKVYGGMEDVGIPRPAAADGRNALQGADGASRAGSRLKPAAIDIATSVLGGYLR